MVRLILSALMMIALMSIGYSAEATIMDFESATPGIFLTADYTEDGMKMTLEAGHYDIFHDSSGNQLLQIDNDLTGLTSQVKFQLDGGGFFDLLGLDVLPVGLDGVLASSAGGSMTLSSAGSVSFSGTDWSMLSWLTLTVYPGSPGAVSTSRIDTIKFTTAVPEPATMLLMGFGLIGLGAARRRLK